MEYVYLQGSEDVQRAGFQISSAASTMQNAANTISSALYDHQQFLSTWLADFERIQNKIS